MTCRLPLQVSKVEQLLTTGGGWQDQVGGIYGGLKICRSNGTLPMKVMVSPLLLSETTVTALQQQLVLIYTGVQVKYLKDIKDV